MPDALVTALEATGLPFAHYGWSKAPKGDYGVYAEWGENTLYAGNRHGERVTQGSVHYFTRDSSGSFKDMIEAALDIAGAAWYLDTIQFEEDTGYIHLEWAWEL